MRARLAVALAAAGGLMSISVGPVAADWCGPHDRRCMRMSVPLDYSGWIPGTVSLRIERARQHGRVRPPVLVVAGDPGESSTLIPQQDFEQLLGSEDSKREVVVVDVRGTGRSSPLRCPSLQRASRLNPGSAAAACARTLGPQRAFYTAADAADDLEAVRRRLGVPQVAIYGVSYGARVALTYARRYPARVERLVLQSVTGPDGIDPLRRSSMRAAGGVIGRFCRKRCRGFTPDAAADLERLAARLARKPISGHIPYADGRRRRVTVDSGALLGLVASTTFSSEDLRGFVPGAVRAALDGDPAQLLRVRAAGMRFQTSLPPLRELSAGARATTLCEDTDLPWDGTTPIADRRERATSFVSRLPPGTFAPFAPQTALGSEVLALCERWPASRRPAQPPMGGLPDVPTLIFAGTLDAHAPVADARAVAALLPQARVLVVGSTGHQIDIVHEECLAKAFRSFLRGVEPGTCPPVPRRSSLGFTEVSWPPPRALGELPPAGGTGRPGRTLNAVSATIFDAWDSLFLGDGLALLRSRATSAKFRAGALRAGAYVFGFRPARWIIRLDRASLVKGVRVSGSLVHTEREIDGESETSGPEGTLVVSGPAAARGTLRLRQLGWMPVRGFRVPRVVVSGRLGGREVRAPLYGRPASAARAGASTQARLAALPARSR